MKLDPVDRNNDLSITHGKPTIIHLNDYLNQVDLYLLFVIL